MTDLINYQELFNESFESVNLNRAKFYELLFDKFVGSSLLVKEAFKNTNMHKQREMVEEAFIHLVDFSADKKADTYLVELAEMHTKLHIHDELFELFIESLLSTLEECDPRFTEEHAMAWRVMLSPGVEFMKHRGDMRA